MFQPEGWDSNSLSHLKVIVDPCSVDYSGHCCDPDCRICSDIEGLHCFEFSIHYTCLPALNMQGNKIFLAYSPLQPSQREEDTYGSDMASRLASNRFILRTLKLAHTKELAKLYGRYVEFAKAHKLDIALQRAALNQDLWVSFDSISLSILNLLQNKCQPQEQTHFVQNLFCIASMLVGESKLAASQLSNLTIKDILNHFPDPATEFDLKASAKEWASHDIYLFRELLSISSGVGSFQLHWRDSQMSPHRNKLAYGRILGLARDRSNSRYLSRVAKDVLMNSKVFHGATWSNIKDQLSRLRLSLPIESNQEFWVTSESACH